MHINNIRQFVRSKLNEIYSMEISESNFSNSIPIKTIEKYDDGKPKTIEYTTNSGHHVNRLLTYKTVEKNYTFELFSVHGHYLCENTRSEKRFKKEFRTLEEAESYFIQIKNSRPFAQIVLTKKKITELMMYQ